MTAASPDIVKFRLSDPIETGRGRLTELDITAPKGRSFLRHGIPFTIEEIVSNDGAIGYRTTFDPKVCFRFLADMTGLDEITLEEISAVDAYGLFRLIVDYSLGRPPQSAT